MRGRPGGPRRNGSEKRVRNVNRAGVVFVGSFEDRDYAPLVGRVADRSLAVYEELLDLLVE